MTNFNPNYTIMDIPTKIYSHSCVGYSKKKDVILGFGNYISTFDGKYEFFIINLSLEDLEYLKRQKIIDDKMKALVVKSPAFNTYAAFVIDERIPEKALTPRWWYDSRHYAELAVMKYLHGDIEDCYCSIDKSIIHFIRTDYVNNINYGICSFCKKNFEVKITKDLV